MSGARIQLKRSTAASWTSNNPVLYVGEIGFETDTKKLKIGDGSTAWTSLSYTSVPIALSALNDLGDVTITSAADGDFLRWNGTAWINDAVNLSTDTIGSYVASLVAGTGVTLTNNSGEGATPTVAVTANTFDAFGAASTAATNAATALTNHEADTTSIHGIADTSILVTTTGSQTLTNKTITSPSGLVKGDVGLGNVDNTSNATERAASATLTNKTLTSPVVNTPTGIVKGDVGLGSVDNTSDTAKPVSTAQQTALDLKAPLASPTFTGTVAGITATMVGLGSVNNTADTAKPVSTAQQTALDLKAPLASPTLTGTPIAPTAAAGNNSTQIATTAYADAAVAALVGTAGATLDTLGEIATALGNDVALSTTLTTSIGLKAPLASPTFTGTVSGITATMVGLGSVDNTSDTGKPVSTAQQTALDLKANLASPTFTGTVSGITSTMVGLGSVNNTADTAKPVSTAQQTALDLKAPLASPSLTGTPLAPTAAGGTNTTQIATTAFVATALSGATITSLDDVADVTITSAASGQFLKWSGTAWVNDAVPIISNIDDITGVTITAAADKDFLMYNGTAWVDQPITLGTDTTGSYVTSLVAGTGVTLSGNSGESATPTVTVDTSVIQARVANVTDTEIGYLDGVTSAIQTQIGTKAPIASPTFTGTVTIPSGASISGYALTTAVRDSIIQLYMEVI